MGLIDANLTLIPDGAVTTAKLADLAVTTGKLAAAAVTAAKIAAGTIVAADLDSTQSYTMAGLTITALTAGSIIFAGAGGLLSQNNANLFWDNTNNRLGISAVPPGATFQLNGTSSIVYMGGPSDLSQYGIEITSAGTGDTPALTLQNTSAGGLKFRVDSFGANPGSFRIRDETASAYRLTIDNSGNFGIGTTTPLNQVSLPNAKTLGWRNAANSTETVGIQSSAADDFEIFTSNTPRLTVLSGGNVGIGTTGPTVALTVNANPAILVTHPTIPSRTLTIDPGVSDILTSKPDNTFTIGDSTFRYVGFAAAGNFRIFATANDANPTSSLESAALKLGAGGGSALDVIITRATATTVNMNAAFLFNAASIPTATAAGIGADANAGNLLCNAPTGKQVQLTINGATIAAFGASRGLEIYRSVNTAAWGTSVIYGQGRTVGATGAVASVAAYTVGAADGSFIVSANVRVTTATTHNFTVTCTYTDESGIVQTLTFNFSTPAGVLGTAIVNTGGTIPYEGVPMHIRAKASTTITIATTGTFTSVVYNVEGKIAQEA